jgi:ribonuclease G
MSKELVISTNRHETRVALIEDDQLVEVYFQRANEYSLAGSIHKGRVTRVLPGMQSAFVDLGLERDTFLYVSDFLEENHEDIDRVTGDEPLPRGGGRDREQRDREQRGRDDRGGRDRDRDRRPQHAQSPPPLPGSEESAIAANGESEGEPGNGLIEARAADAPSTPTTGDAGTADRPAERGPERGEERDRHGRRSRRRRSRGGGRGFPDAKYAGAGTGDRAQSNDRTVSGDRPPSGDRPGDRSAERSFERPAAAPTEHAESFEFAESAAPPIILPGESLAKYRDAPVVETSRSETPVEPPVEPRVSQGPPPLPAAFVSAPESHPVSHPLAGPISEPVPAGIEEFSEPTHFPSDNAIPDAPMHHAGALTDGPVPTDEGPTEEAIEEEEAAGGPAVASLLDEDEDRDIQEMILSHAEGLDEPESEESEGDEADEAEEGSELAVEGAAETAAGDEANAGLNEAGEARTESESGTAAVRERGGRYPHRGVGGRRPRRRGRGGDRGDRASGDRPAGDRALGERTGGDRQAGAGGDRTVSRPAIPAAGQISITDLLKEGQEIIVQIAKEPLGQKGARITSHIALPGRYVVFMPTLEHMGVSRKISSDEERLRLKRILQGRRPGPMGGFITRTAAEGRTEEEIAADMAFLYNLWMDIRNKAEKRPAPMLLHHDLDIVQRILRDQLADNFKAIWIDNEDAYESVLRFVERFQPALVGKVKLYTRDAPIFDAFNVTSELEKALRPKVWLKSGGYIVINQTEALVAIDVNTGKYVGKSNRLEDTIVKTNTEAIKEIVRQVRLRDLGGIIVIDFIDMDERKNRQKVMQVLEEAMRVDRAPYKILQFNDFGLVAITRKRVKQSLERTLCSPCPHCEGAGYIKSVQTVVSEILTEARKMASSVEGKDVMLRVHPDVAKVLKSNHNKFLEELEEVLRRPVLVRSDAQLHHEKFDLA